MNDLQPPPPPTEPPAARSDQPSSGTFALTALTALTARNAVLAAGFVVLVLGALADIAHFLEDHDPSASLPATVLLQQDSAGPPLPATPEANDTPEAPVVPEATATPGTFFDPVFNTHTVEPGDVLYDIANRYGTTTQVLIDLNSLPDPNRIEVGQVLALPESATQS